MEGTLINMAVFLLSTKSLKGDTQITRMIKIMISISIAKNSRKWNKRLMIIAFFARLLGGSSI